MACSRRPSVLLLDAALFLPALPARATIEMQDQAKKLGFALHNCLYCHASPHAIEKMKEKARAAGTSEGNCLACQHPRRPQPPRRLARGREGPAQREDVRHGLAQGL